MRYLKYCESFLQPVIESICKEYEIRKYNINPDGSINVYEDVDISNTESNRLKLKFHEVRGDFICSYVGLTSLEGCPISVSGDFYCENNQLTSFEGCPISVGGDFYCNNNQIISLEWFPKHIGKEFSCFGNPIEHIWELFEDYNKIELFNDYDIIRSRSIILDRLNEFLEVIGKPTVKKVKGYKNI